MTEGPLDIGDLKRDEQNINTPGSDDDLIEALRKLGN